MNTEPTDFPLEGLRGPTGSIGPHNYLSSEPSDTPLQGPTGMTGPSLNRICHIDPDGTTEILDTEEEITNPSQLFQALQSFIQEIHEKQERSRLSQQFWKHPTQENFDQILKDVQSDLSKTNESGLIAHQVWIATVYQTYGIGDAATAQEYLNQHQELIYDARHVPPGQMTEFHMDVLWAIFGVTGDPEIANRVFQAGTTPYYYQEECWSAARWSYSHFQQENPDLLPSLPEWSRWDTVKRVSWFLKQAL